MGTWSSAAESVTVPAAELTQRSQLGSPSCFLYILRFLVNHGLDNKDIV